jgi:hypothetical protein
VLGLARLIILALLVTPAVHAYSVLTHEAIVDSVWDTSLKKLLLKRFPSSTPEELEKAHAYAYGGCIVQDMGYYPFSSTFFSDLTHYVRSGDFVAALVAESKDIDEYAFALGALAHYAADNSGHSIGTNVAVPLLYPELRTKFGKTVTYWDNPISHLRTEFSFDVLQVAQGRYAPAQYHSFIGFEVSKPVLERAFRDTYGLEMKEVFGTLDLALGSFRYSVSSVIPEMTRVAWQLKKETFIKEIPGITRKKFLYTLSRASYRKEWGVSYRQPGFGTRFFAFMLRVLPKVGPFRSLAFRRPTPEVEKLYMASFNSSVDAYRAILAQLDAGHLEMINTNLDLGTPAAGTPYDGTELTYGKLVDTLAKHKFDGLSAELRENILDYYAKRKPPVPQSTPRALAATSKLTENLAQLQQVSLSAPHKD